MGCVCCWFALLLLLSEERLCCRKWCLMPCLPCSSHMQLLQVESVCASAMQQVHLGKHKLAVWCASSTAANLLLLLLSTKTRLLQLLACVVPWLLRPCLASISVHALLLGIRGPCCVS